MLDNPDIRNWISVIIAAIISCGAGLLDAFQFHYFGANTDLVLLMAGLGALGLHTTATTMTNNATRVAASIANNIIKS
jgi:hypothetical protein